MIRYFAGYSSCNEVLSNEKEYKNYPYWCIRYLNENDQLHRLDGPAVEFYNGTKAWYINGLSHRLDGPAIEHNGNKFWYINGLSHRLDGPALEYYNGKKNYYYNGEYIDVSTDKEFKKYLKLKTFK
jgi:hypothetical protein